MTNDGSSLEKEPPIGWVPPVPIAWIGPDGKSWDEPEAVVDGNAADGLWRVQVPIHEEMMMRVNVEPTAV
jgi:hypothetical protein